MTSSFTLHTNPSNIRMLTKQTCILISIRILFLYIYSMIIVFDSSLRSHVGNGSPMMSIIIITGYTAVTDTGELFKSLLALFWIS